ncbi:MAG: hypothetical protein NZ870_02550, partial [bacterium]|nr:hypothetical protein [bacterium]
FLENAILGAKKNWGYNTYFYYPSNGIKELPDNMYKEVSKNHLVFFNEEVKKVEFSRNLVYTTSLIIKYKKLVSTIPLKKLCDICDDLELKKLAKGLIANKVLCLNIGAKGIVKKISWIYFPDKYPFYRIGVQSYFSKNVAPKGYSSFYIEFSLKEKEKPVYHKLYSIAIMALIELGLIKSIDDIVSVLWIEIPFGYVVFNEYRKSALNKIFSKLEKYNCYTAGRYGKWEYTFMEKAILDGVEVAEKIKKI